MATAKRSFNPSGYCGGTLKSRMINHVAAAANTTAASRFATIVNSIEGIIMATCKYTILGLSFGALAVTFHATHSY